MMYTLRKLQPRQCLLIAVISQATAEAAKVGAKQGLAAAEATKPSTITSLFPASGSLSLVETKIRLAEVLDLASYATMVHVAAEGATQLGLEFNADDTMKYKLGEIAKQLL